MITSQRVPSCAMIELPGTSPQMKCISVKRVHRLSSSLAAYKKYGEGTERRIFSHKSHTLEISVQCKRQLEVQTFLKLSSLLVNVQTNCLLADINGWGKHTTIDHRDRSNGDGPLQPYSVSRRIACNAFSNIESMPYYSSDRVKASASFSRFRCYRDWTRARRSSRGDDRERTVGLTSVMNCRVRDSLID